jgi:hypothetical protein
MRGRNRGGGGGKGPNPLSRSYESNGPDVKVRGTAAHIAEKYVQLARDAQASGDPILAEAYLQHAEHYFRIIAAAQPQFGAQQPFASQPEEEEYGEDLDFEGPIPSLPQNYGQPSGEEQPRFAPRERGPGERQGFGDRQPYGDRQDGERGHQERPYQDRQGGERARNDRFQGERGPRQDRGPDRSFEGPTNGFRGEGEGGDGDRPFNPRHGRRDRRFNDRPYQDRQPYHERGGGERQPYQERGFQPQPAAQPVVPVDQPQPEVGDEAQLSALPSFITAGPAQAAPAAAEGEGEARFPLRNRRRRTAKRPAEEGEAPASEPGVAPVAE